MGKDLPWFNGEVRRIWQKKNWWFRKSKKTNNQTVHDKYRRTLYEFKNALKGAEREYNEKRINACKGDSRKVWKFVNGIRGVNYSNSMVWNGGESKTQDVDMEMVEKYNEFYNKLPIRLLEKMQKDEQMRLRTDCARDGGANCVRIMTNSMFMNDTDQEEIVNIISKLRNSATNDVYNVRVIKTCVYIISPFLVDIINQCLRDGVFPNQWKRYMIRPIYKGKGCRNEPENYRPISLQSIMSKILEKVIYVRLVNFLDKYRVLSINQFGFREGYSTMHAILRYTNKVYELLDKKQYVIGVFFDLAKAFNTISHSILLQKMSNIGIRGDTLRLFNSYLKDRFQCVKMGDVRSQYSRMEDFGVIQGTILGPLLFLIYVNDLDKTVGINTIVSLYADDTAFVFHGDSREKAMDMANEGVDRYYKWAMLQKLSVNMEKSNYMIYGKNKGDLQQMTVNMNGKILSRVETVKFLGVLIDDEFTFKQHINELITKIKKTLPIFYRIRDVLTFQQKRMIYFALIQAHVSYCLVIYGTASKFLLNKLQVVTNRAMRILFKVGMGEHLDDAYRKVGLPLILQEYKFQLYKIAHAHYYSTLPSAVRDEFPSRIGEASRVVRNGSCYFLQSIRTSYGQRLITHRIRKYVNMNDNLIRNSYPHDRSIRSKVLRVLADRLVP